MRFGSIPIEEVEGAVVARGPQIDGAASLREWVGAIVLAAGRSSRFRAAGGPDATKLIAKLDGKPIVRIVAETAIASKARPVVVVVGHERQAVEAALAGLGVQIAFNADFSSGLASSLRAGLSALPADAAGAVVLLGDMPLIAARLIDTLIDAFGGEERALACAPSFEGRRGNPVLMGRRLFEAAMRLDGDEGARRLIAALGPSECLEIETPDAGVTFDIDTPSDLARARQEGSGDISR